MRNRYIRFFVSSTFADMKKERNLLQEVIDMLANEYIQKGWQIESVDLRWGISEEAGLENKTMQICRTELERCQELSPKPNFIVLLGNRYGWIPLPEVVSPKDVKLIMYNPSVKKTSKDLFYQWYKLDENALPDGEYVLQGRTGRFVDKEIWEKEVVSPLSELFSIVVDGSQIVQNSFLKKLFPKRTHWISRSLYGLSATELEIQKGALSVDDAQEHVLAYIRDIKDVSKLPRQQTEIYTETGWDSKEKIQKLIDLKNKLRSKISKTNTIEKSVLWSDYNSDTYSYTLKDEFESHLRTIIKQTIDNYRITSEETAENQIHKDIAFERSKNFVGRQDELNFIETYIKDIEQRGVLLISGPSGSGKSALMGKVVEKYSESHHVICRFCSATPSSSNENNLIFSIVEDVCSQHEIDVQYRQTPNIFHHLSVVKPVLIIVDAINEIGTGREFIQKFIPCKKNEDGEIIELPLAINVKIIITSTDSYDLKSSYLQQYSLKNMGNDSLSLIQYLLSSNGRRLSSPQYDILNSIIENSDKSALYLHVLGYYLVETPSWKDISSTPEAIDKLITCIVDNFSLPERHGSTAKEVLSLLALERSGLTDKEISNLLVFDEVFYNEFKNKSLQKWDEHNGHFIPPVLWLRLKYSLRFLIKERFTENGKVITFFHNGIKQSVYNSLFEKNKKETLHFYLLLYNFYKNRLQFDDRHAYEELLHCGNVVASLSYDSSWNNDLCNELSKYIEEDAVFIGKILKLASTYLVTDLDESLSCLRKPLKEVLTFRDIISDNVSGANLKASIKRLPSWHLYRKTFEMLDESKLYMEDSLANTFEQSTIFTVNEIGDCPCMNEDGTKVASLFKNGHEVRIVDLLSPEKSITFTHRDKMLKIQSDGMLRYFVIRFENSCMIYDSKESKVVVSYELSINDRTYLSNNSKYLIIESDSNIEIIDLDNDLQSVTTLGISCNCSSSEKYVWVISTEGVLGRFDTSTFEEGTTFPILLKNEKKEDYNPFLSPKCKILTCSDNICVCQEGFNTIIILHYYSEDCRHQFNYQAAKYHDVQLAVIADNEEKVVVVNEGTCEVYVKDRTGSLKCETATYLEDVTKINSDLSKALLGNKIVNLSILLKQFIIGKGGNSGLNGMSIDNSGNQIFVASGINAFFDWQIDCERVSFAKKHKWAPPFDNPYYQYLAGIAVSPNGECLIASSMGENQLMCYSLKSDISLTCFPINTISNQSDDNTIYYGACIGMSFSSDSRYGIAMTGHHIGGGVHRLYILDNKGNIVQQYDNMDYPWGNNGTVGFSANNRYVYSGDYECMIKDVIIQTDITKEKDMRCTEVQLEITNIPCKFFSIVVDITSLNLLLTQCGGLLYSMNFDTGKVTASNCNMNLLGCSPTGRYLYFESGGRLYMKKYQSEEVILLYDNVERLIPAFDEDHIYIIKEGKNIVLYNVKLKEVEQIAHTSLPIIYHRVCAKGLAVVTTLGYTLLFSPDKSFKVNQPAVTNYVKRWNLKTKQQMPPTAICPMCGGEINITPQIQSVLVDKPTERMYSDWEKPSLFGHHCPYCNAELRFNPYIV